VLREYGDPRWEALRMGAVGEREREGRRKKKKKY
jgi:hypothetical protein